MCEHIPSQITLEKFLILYIFSSLTCFVFSQNNTCAPCDPSCNECKGPGPYSCISCPVLQRLTEDGRCLHCCGENTLADSSRFPSDCCQCHTLNGTSFKCIHSTLKKLNIYCETIFPQKLLVKKDQCSFEMYSNNLFLYIFKNVHQIFTVNDMLKRKFSFNCHL